MAIKNLESLVYWSVTEYAPGTDGAWGFGTGNGSQGGGSKNDEFYAWAVRSGDVAGNDPTGVPEPGTLLLLGAGLVGLAARRRR